MYAGNADIKTSIVVIILIKSAFRIHDIQLCSKQQSHITILSRYYMIVPEIYRFARTWDIRGVLCNAINLQAFLLCLCYHFGKAAVSVARHYGMGMYVKFDHYKV